MPWSTLCRADWVRNDPVLTTRGWLLRHYGPVSPGAARGHAAASEHQEVSLMGLGKRGRLRVDQPTITGRTRPAPDAYSPLFACDDRTFVDQSIAPQTAGLSVIFFLETARSGLWKLRSRRLCRVHVARNEDGACGGPRYFRKSFIGNR